ncbi:helix-turn-helix transcriptional regulator [Nocardia sp. CA-136227]|uniref:helix-turn-helix transcriptional regulator n=1 Tax=Nocardia sp. CA-136227 TaxID=3239979 RepID=UPI003D9777C0
MPDNHRSELAAFLKAHRARLTPKDVGLLDDPEPGRRRTPGLRREEVAELAGVSLTWYTWLEQARKIAASPQVVDALARALLLSPAEHRHLRTLAGLADPVERKDIDDGRLQRLVDALMPDLAVVHDARFDFVVWNAAFARVRVDPAELPADRRNLLWWMFTDDRTRAMMPRWERAARAILGQFRAVAGRTPDNPDLTALITALTEASPEFRTWWQEYPVQDFRPATITLNHPTAGPLDLDVHQLRPVDNPDLLMVVQLPATPDDRHRIATLLDNDRANRPTGR